jgi:tetratricopeptide (TPR) repeat protein
VLSKQKRLKLWILAWSFYAAILTSEALRLTEGINECLDALGFEAVVDTLGGFAAVIVMAVAVLVPLAAILRWHAGAETNERRRTPSEERNQAGMAIFAKGAHSSAIAQFTAAIHLDPHFAPAYCNRGVAAFHLGRFEEARADLDAALRLAPDLVDAFQWRAQVALATGDYDGVIADTDGAILRGRTFSTTFLNRGMAWLEKGQLERALADFEEALRLEPTSGLAFNNRGAAHLKLGDYPSAVADFHEAMRLDPSLPNPYKNLAWLWATCPHREMRDGAGAVPYAHKALQMVDLKMPEWLGILAAACAEAGDFDEALVWQTKCVDSVPAERKPHQEARLALYQARQPYRSTKGELC